MLMMMMMMRRRRRRVHVPFELKNRKQSHHDSKLIEMTMNLEVGPWGQAKINSFFRFSCAMFLNPLAHI